MSLSALCRTRNFNPRAPCGARLSGLWAITPTRTAFQPTRPLRGATCLSAFAFWIATISTHAPLAGRDKAFRPPLWDRHISTHAPLAGRDAWEIMDELMDSLISTHAPLAGRDPRRYTRAVCRPDFNPRAPCGARHHRRRMVRSKGGNFNPRAPCGARPRPECRMLFSVAFQPTRPLRGATK